jgi:hypothetical protein
MAPNPIMETIINVLVILIGLLVTFFRAGLAKYSLTLERTYPVLKRKTTTPLTKPEARGPVFLAFGLFLAICGVYKLLAQFF